MFQAAASPIALTGSPIFHDRIDAIVKVDTKR
jgi:hypothetical protein